MQELIEVTNKTERPKRRTYTKQFKADLIAQCDKEDRSVAQIAMSHQINANLLRKWQREAHQSSSGPKLLPVAVAVNNTAVSGAGEIEVAIGGVVVRFNGPVDPGNASTILGLLR